MEINTENTEAIAGVPPKFRNVAKFRIKEAEYKVSQRGMGKPMFILTTEICSPELGRSPLDGKTYNILGQEVMWFVMLNAEKGNLAAVQETLLPALGIEMFEGEEPDKEYMDQFKNQYFVAVVGTKEEKDQTLNPDTNEYESLVDPDTGEEITKGWAFTSFFKDIIRGCDKPEGYEPLDS